jgi:hypothetical protein
MSRKPKLNDLQLILLASAIQRDDGSILPFPATLTNKAGRARKVIPALLRRKLVEEAVTGDRARSWREADDQMIGLFATAAGRTAIAAGDSELESAGEERDARPTSEKAKARTGTKAELVLALLQRPEGATLAELVDATGWLPHTTRAALTGVRKKGHALQKTKRADATCYRVAEVG